MRWKTLNRGYQTDLLRSNLAKYNPNYRPKYLNERNTWRIFDDAITPIYEKTLQKEKLIDKKCIRKTQNEKFNKSPRKTIQTDWITVKLMKKSNTHFLFIMCYIHPQIMVQKCRSMVLVSSFYSIQCWLKNLVKITGSTINT